jgi:glycerophosphoryl diester phosphodiesterase
MNGLDHLSRPARSSDGDRAVRFSFVSPRPLVIAHRGTHGAGVAENTLAAFRQAAALGADMIELDVRLAADGELVVFHDEKVGPDAVGSLTLAALRERSETDIPRLTEVLDWASGRIGLDVELKEDGYVDRVAELLAVFAAEPARWWSRRS